LKLQDFLEGEYLSEQVDSIKELADLTTRLERLHCKELGLHMIDQELASKYSK
jgi:ferritin heavy chain